MHGKESSLLIYKKKNLIHIKILRYLNVTIGPMRKYVQHLVACEALVLSCVCDCSLVGLIAHKTTRYDVSVLLQVLRKGLSHQLLISLGMTEEYSKAVVQAVAVSGNDCVVDAKETFNELSSKLRSHGAE